MPDAARLPPSPLWNRTSLSAQSVAVMVDTLRAHRAPTAEEVAEQSATSLREAIEGHTTPSDDDPPAVLEVTATEVDDDPPVSVGDRARRVLAIDNASRDRRFAPPRGVTPIRPPAPPPSLLDDAADIIPTEGAS